MSFLTRDYTEKRNFIRMQVGSPIELTTESGDTYTGTCIDLSGGGMLVEIEQALEANSQLIATVISSQSHGPTLKAECSVARVEQTGKKSYYLGLMIEQILNEPAEDEDLAEAQ